jgi:ABC-2 type transport system ATP-binding protein
LKLTIQDINKDFKSKKALIGVTTELTEGVYGILGANGSGKTTLMRILASVLNPTSGKVLLDGEDISEMGDNYRDLLGYLPQHIGYYKNFTAEKFLLYIAALKGLDKVRAKKQVEELLELVNLIEHRKEKVGKFSGGMKQRVGIAQALLNDPKILIVDEPTAGLDPKERIRFRNIISEIAHDRIVILSTHIVSDIEYIAKEVMILKDGELIYKNTTQQLLAEMNCIVWKVLVTDKELSSMKKKYKIGNMIRRDDGVELRILSREKPHHNAILDTPNLEDLYLFYFDKEPVA